MHVTAERRHAARTAPPAARPTRPRPSRPARHPLPSPKNVLTSKLGSSESRPAM